MSFIKDILNATADAESPERFYYWAALSALSAVVRRNIWWDRFKYIEYPNLYVFLVAKSGGRKGLPVMLARSLVTGTTATRVVAGRTSIQAVIRDLAKLHKTNGGAALKDAHGFLVAPELASFFVKDPDALPILTDLYDTYSHKEWKNTLKGGNDILKMPCLTLLGATNEEHFYEAVPASSIGGGFIARTLIIYEEGKRNVNSLMYENEALTIDEKPLINYLTDVSKLKGKIVPTHKARSTYDTWYRSFESQTKNDPTGTLERVHSNAVKVAMLLALSEDLTLEVNERHVDEAICVCMGTLGGMRKLTMGTGKSNLASQTRTVIKALLSAPAFTMTRARILRNFWGQLDRYDLDRIVATLEGAGAIRITNETELAYTLTEETVRTYSSLLD